ncbi:peptidoglycan/LPS O-acetylase OafA/YrhL [Mucilaginibacter frigoritolerans]|uniref:Peptidoglycan/LPS O-acetylase OafA/YrhL n=1 Tax=Mucilaginibacter frigoritolerans TaxID=652788 RepID=A0A562UFP6_9SPHI|nr:acyltransferase [Mucilaginibacter frigoritolerans]TWJ04618.1 peptidoglycan/LPS O-acetylase OafA/YrhL [Mucilaginibacter frigoritolerans]
MKNNDIKEVRPDRFKELDALRGIAVLGVLLYHYTVAYDYHYNLDSTGKFHFIYGFLAVELFFMISGFVILLTLEKSKKKADFLVSRFSRLYPAYWASIFLTTLLITLFPIPTLGHYTAKEIVINLTMLQGFGKIRLIDQVYWTLKLELIFYGIMYIIYAAKQLKNIVYICFPWLTISVLSCLFKIPLKKYLDVLLILQYAPLFIAGINFYKLKSNSGGPMSHLLIVLSLLVEFLWVYHTDVDNSYLSVMIFLTAFYLIFYTFAYKGLPILKNKLLLFFGTISYSLYLLHNVIGYVIIYRLRTISDKQLFYIPITFVVVVSLAVLVTFGVEKPALKLIRTYYKKNKVPTGMKATDVAQLP